MGRQYKYILFGYKVLSDIKLDIEENEFNEFDVRVLVIDELYYYDYPEDIKWDIIVGDDKTELMFYDAGRFTLSTGKIEFTPIEDYDSRAVVMYLTGFVFGNHMIIDDKYCIHGSVININGKAYIFSGESGAGKSSIARGFINKGYKMLSDDISVIDIEDGYKIIPSFPSQKLWEETAAVFGVETDKGKKTCLLDDKFFVDVAGNFYNDKLILGGIFVIEVSEEPLSIKSLDSNDRLANLINHTYISDMYRYYNKNFSQLKFMATLAEHVPVFIINRPKGLVTVDSQIELVLRYV